MRVVDHNKGCACPRLDLSQGLLALVHNGDEAPPSGDDRLALATMSAGLTDAHVVRANKPSFAHMAIAEGPHLLKAPNEPMIVVVCSFFLPCLAFG